jgi:hypothetical protein
VLLSFRNLVLSSAVLCATAAFAAEQRRLEVPFNFVAKNHAYQAGPYTVTVDWARSLLTLREVTKTSQPMMWIILPGDYRPGDAKISLTFDVIGPDHVLRTIQYGTFITPNLDAKPKHPVEGTTTIGD